MRTLWSRAKRSDPRRHTIVIVHAQLDDGSPQTSTTRSCALSLTCLFPAGAENHSRIDCGRAACFDREFPASSSAGANDPAAHEDRGSKRSCDGTSPSVYKRRTTTRDTELKGCRIRGGQKGNGVGNVGQPRRGRVRGFRFASYIGRDPNYITWALASGPISVWARTSRGSKSV